MGKRIKKMPVIILLAGIMVIILIVALLGSSKNVKITDVINVDIMGTDGYGYVNVSIKPDFLAENGLSVNSISYMINKNNNLKNGDVIKITLEDIKGISLDNNTLEYVVEGLIKGTDLDIFKDLIVEYDNSSKKIILDNSQCSEFIKENVIFSINREKEEYNVGDIVKINGYVDMNAAAKDGYNILATEYEYVVE